MENGWPRPAICRAFSVLLANSVSSSFTNQALTSIGTWHMSPACETNIQQSWSKSMKFKLLWFSRVFNGQNPSFNVVELFDGNILINALSTINVASSCGPWWVSALPTAFAHPIAMTGTPKLQFWKAPVMGRVPCYGKTCLHMSSGGNRNRFRILEVSFPYHFGLKRLGIPISPEHYSYSTIISKTVWWLFVCESLIPKIKKIHQSLAWRSVYSHGTFIVLDWNRG